MFGTNNNNELQIMMAMVTSWGRRRCDKTESGAIATKPNPGAVATKPNPGAVATKPNPGAGNDPRTISTVLSQMSA
jgi:hypothetical protein